MNHVGTRPEGATLDYLGLKNLATAFWNLSPAELVEETISLEQGSLTSTGALAVDTGEFTGRSPKDKFIVKDSKTLFGGVNSIFHSKAPSLIAYLRECKHT
jgi:phosphoenolpyruvate carboxykinase (ATP)